MSYRYQNPHQRPLIDLIPDHSPGLDLDVDVSDEEDAFYTVDEGDYLLDAKWRALATRTSNRIPRRLKRYIAIYIPCFILFVICWIWFIGPQYSVYKQEQMDMDSAPKDRFGLNKKPEFKDLVQVKTLDKKHVPRGERRLMVVGDVHGCKKELEKLLKKVEFKEGKDHLILTGDIINKGPDSPGVVSLASRLGASCVRGNHEDKVLLSLAALPSSNTFPEASAHTDSKTLNLAKSFTAHQISYLQTCPVILDVGPIGSLQHVAIVHAGLVPNIALQDQDPFQVMNMRSIDLKTGLPSENRDGKPWTKLWNHQMKKKPVHERTTVIYGHDSKRGMNVKKWSFGLDSSCVKGGRLTAMVIGESGEHRFVDVRCKGYVD